MMTRANAMKGIARVVIHLAGCNEIDEGIDHAANSSL